MTIGNLEDLILLFLISQFDSRKNQQLKFTLSFQIKNYDFQNFKISLRLFKDVKKS